MKNFNSFGSFQQKLASHIFMTAIKLERNQATLSQFLVIIQGQEFMVLVQNLENFAYAAP